MHSDGNSSRKQHCQGNCQCWATLRATCLPALPHAWHKACSALQCPPSSKNTGKGCRHIPVSADGASSGTTTPDILPSMTLLRPPCRLAGRACAARCASSRRWRNGGSGNPEPWWPESRSWPYRLSTTCQARHAMGRDSLGVWCRKGPRQALQHVQACYQARPGRTEQPVIQQSCTHPYRGPVPLSRCADFTAAPAQADMSLR